MKRKIALLISALCALSACASFTACMADSQNGNEENIEKARTKTNIVEQQGNDDNDGNECPDVNCPKNNPKVPDTEDVPPMPEFRFIPHPEHMPNPANSDKSAKNTEENSDENGNNADNEDSEMPENGKKPPMPAPHKGGKIKPKMPKKGD